MNNEFIPKGIEIVQQAIDADNLGENEKALELYKKSLQYFLTGLKYEQNQAAKKMLSDRIAGYMKRAEELKIAIEGSSAPPSSGGGATSKTLSKNDSVPKEDEENQKMRSALSSAIVSEKPNIKWDDVAGLEGTKENKKV
jgi:vacuolar protein-sorting-associated protein 4